MLVVMAAVGGAWLPRLACAHHSAAEYDPDRIIEFSGTLSEVAWQNPHVLLKVASVEAGTSTTWEIECNPVGALERSGVHRRSLKVGDKVKVAGFASRLSPTRVFGTNLLTPDSGELLLVPTESKPRWQGSAGPNFASSSPASAPAAPASMGIFKVWTSVMSDPDANPVALWRANVSLTPAAKRAIVNWDSLRDTIAHGCSPQGMPAIMAQPLPMQFEDHGATIVLRIEEYDTVRTIHMDDGAAPPGKSLLGYSLGKWVGSVLVVDTTGVSWPYIAPNGLPLGRSARMQERFMLSADGKRLRYTLSIDDPDTFTVAPVLGRSWVWQENEVVREYACGKTQNPPS
jgi:hypothetical protein